MISQQELQGTWNQLKGRIKERWGQLTDNDLTQGEGNVEQLVGMIQQKTGAARRDVEAFFDQAVKDGGNMANRAANTARDYANQASEYASQAGEYATQYANQASEAFAQRYDDMQQQLQQGYQQAEDVIRARPAESLTVAFGAGLVTGIVVSLLIRSSR